MDTKTVNGNYIQCLSCGNVYVTESDVPSSVSVTRCECPNCGYEKGLNCGDKEEDVYYFYDPCLDERYY